MLITDEEAKDLKVWIIKKLENISDADSDVLADYVLALIRAEAPIDEIRANATENLEDFLKDNTSSFVQEVFQVIQSKSYIPGYVASSPAVIPPTQAIPTGPLSQVGAKGGFGGHDQRSRKRSFNDAQGGHGGQDAHYQREDRQMKQMRRGGGRHGGRGGFGAAGGDLNADPSQMFPGMGALPPGMQFDPNDPMAAMLALQAMGIPMPGGPNAGFLPGNNSQGPGKNRVNARCRDYDTKGYCMRGVNCPFNHGDNHIVVSDTPNAEYDPRSPSMGGFPKAPGSIGSAHTDPTNSRGRGRGRGRGGMGGQRSNNRAEFSKAGPNQDTSVTTVVVEQIPEASFDETSVRTYFSEFGKIEEVTMQPYRRLALVKYDSFEAARAAYQSPKAIFDNRFVKVYWYDPEKVPKPPGNGHRSAPHASGSHAEEEPFDREKFERDAAEAQKKLEERKALQQKTQAQLSEIQKAKEELERKKAEAKQKLQEKMKAKGMLTESDVSKENTSQTTGTEGSETKSLSKTEALKAQLKALEDEAERIGLDRDPQNNPDTSSRGRGRGRGSYRGWEGFRGRGSYRGRGAAFSPMPRGGGAYNLDNRPKSVKVEGVQFDDEKDESLKQFLFSVGEFTSIEPSESKTSETIAFVDRLTAEKFFYGPKDIPGVGKLEFSWIKTPLPLVKLPAATAHDDDTAMEGVDVEATTEKVNGRDEDHDRVEDYDVAGEDDWIA